MNIDFIIEIPVANALRFTREGVNDNERANFDQVRFSQAHFTGIDPRKFFQPMEKADLSRPQFYSNFPTNKVQVINCDNQILFDENALLAAQYRGKKYRSDCSFGSYNGKLFIYFEQGFEYLDDNFQQQGNAISLEGRLPNINAQVGDALRYQIQDLGFQFTTIQQIIWNPDLQAEGYLTNVDIGLTEPATGVVEVTYNEKPADLYYQEIDWSLFADGIYYVRLLFQISNQSISYLSEPIDLKELHRDTLAIDYRHDGDFDEPDIWGYLYLSDWTNRFRIPSNHHQITPAGEIDVYTDDPGTQKQTRAMPVRQITFKAFDLPGWVIDKFNMIFAHDTKIINGYQWENEDFGNFTIINRTDIGDFEINLRQVNDRVIVHNLVTLDLTAEFIPNNFPDIPFGGDVVNVQFISNTTEEFHFQNLPAWIMSDKVTFVNGDIIQLTISENPGSINRSATLIAVNDDIPELTASLEITQLFEEEPLFIDASPKNIQLDGSGSDNSGVSVSASGPYTPVVIGEQFIDVSIQSPGLIIIFETESNPGPNQKNATVRLLLDADNNIFVDIEVTQLVHFVGEITNVTPDLINAPAGGSIEIIVVEAAGTQWQASTVQSWIHISTEIFTGTQFFPVTVDAIPVEISDRIGFVQFTNINNPSNFLVVQINQVNDGTSSN